MKLSRYLGFKHSDEMHAYLSTAQYEDWIEYYQSVGLGDDREDILFALICQCLTGHKEIRDFMPYYRATQIETTPELLRAKIMRALNK